MKKLLNTLYITRQESYLHKERETIVIKQGQDKLGQFPAISIANILCFGRVSVLPVCREKPEKGDRFIFFRQTHENKSVPF